jgi:hypothetical protein
MHAASAATHLDDVLSRRLYLPQQRPHESLAPWLYLQSCSRGAQAMSEGQGTLSGRGGTHVPPFNGIAVPTSP